MLHAVENEVTYLKRIRMGAVLLDEGLPRGGYRKLTKEEVESLKYEKNTYGVREDREVQA
jgi:16S rRNA pseudouridine516 synthase